MSVHLIYCPCCHSMIELTETTYQRVTDGETVNHTCPECNKGMTLERAPTRPG